MPQPTEKPPTPFTSWRRWGIAGVAVMAAAIVVGILVGVLFGEDRGWVVGGAALALGSVLRVSRPLHREPWFWSAMAGLTGVHAIAAVKVDWSWTHSWNGRSLSGLITLDFLVMLGIVYGLYCLIYGRPASNFAEDADDQPDYGDRDLNL